MRIAWPHHSRVQARGERAIAESVVGEAEQLSRPPVQIHAHDLVILDAGPQRMYDIQVPRSATWLYSWCCQRLRDGFVQGAF